VAIRNQVHKKLCIFLTGVCTHPTHLVCLRHWQPGPILYRGAGRPDRV